MGITWEGGCWRQDRQGVDPITLGRSLSKCIYPAESHGYWRFSADVHDSDRMSRKL
jgi:hypothetical protein